MSARGLGAAVALAAIAIVLWVRGCSGPDPVVVEARLVPPAADATPYRVETTVQNRGPGDGQIQVDIRLRDGASGRVLHRDETLRLGRGETALVVTQIDAPPAAYTLEVEAGYPPG